MNTLVDYHKTSPTQQSREHEDSPDRQDLNYGQIVERAVRRNSVGISEIAHRLGVSRRTLYNWFDLNELSPEVVSKIGLIIDCDFSSEFPEAFFKGTKAFGTEVTGGPSVSSGVSLKDPVYYWMSRYIKLLENFNERLDQQRTIER